MIDWKRAPQFKPGEFAENPNEHADPDLIYRLQDYRTALGCIIRPSLARGGLARFDGSATSRHYAVGRLSDACDLFPETPPEHAWATALRMPAFGGIGIYFDTRNNQGNPAYMIHLDLRPTVAGVRTLWWRDDGRYYYPRAAQEIRQLFDRIAGRNN